MFQHLKSLIKNTGPLQVAPQKPLKEDAPVVDISNVKLSSPPNYKTGESVATRFAYGTALAKIGTNNDRVIALDGDTKNSTYSDRLKKVRIMKFPDICYLKPPESWLQYIFIRCICICSYRNCVYLILQSGFSILCCLLSHR